MGEEILDVTIASDVVVGTVPITVNVTATTTETLTWHEWCFDVAEYYTQRDILLEEEPIDWDAMDALYALYIRDAQNTSYTYAEPGTYTIEFYCEKDEDYEHYYYAELTDYFTFTAPDLAVVDFTASATTINPSATVTFTDATTGRADSYGWNYGENEGTDATTQNGSHQYNSEGTFTVTHTATNYTGTDTHTHTDYISVVPRVTVPVVVVPYNIHHHINPEGKGDDYTYAEHRVAEDAAIQAAKGTMCDCCSYRDLGARCPMYLTELCDRIRGV